MKQFLFTLFAVLFTAINANAQNVFSIVTDANNSSKHVYANIIKNYQSNAKDAVYNPPDSPTPGTWNSNTYTELGWTDINVSETDNVSVVTVDYTWVTMGLGVKIEDSEIKETRLAISRAIKLKRISEVETSLKGKKISEINID